MNCEEETIPKALLEPIPRSPTPERALLNDQESDEMKCERPRLLLQMKTRDPQGHQEHLLNVESILVAR